jgi:hypothetical protein
MLGMQIAEEPLVTRREILRSFKLGAPSTDAPFATLRSHKMASPGWSVLVRKDSGRVAGRLHMYSVLNVDAARAVRRRRPELAQRLAGRARELEDSAAANEIRDAVGIASTRLSAHLAGRTIDDAWSDRLHRYLQLRQRAGYPGLERDAIAREWLARSEAWLHVTPDGRVRLSAAVRQLAAKAQAARVDVLADEMVEIDSFTGIVSHLDPELAAITSQGNEEWVMSRRELDREGLARIGEAVTLIREELPGGGEAWLAAPAVDLTVDTEPRSEDGISPFTGPANWVLGASDGRWLKRALIRDPFVLPRIPVRVGFAD